MDFSKVPTDNLYKCAAIMGLCLLTYCINLFINTWTDYHQQKHNLEVEKEMILIEQKSINDDKNTATNELKSFSRLVSIQLQGGNLALEDLRNEKISGSEFRSEINKQMSDLMEREKSHIKMFADIQEKQRILDIHQKRFAFNKNIYSGFFRENTIFFTMWILGFVTSIVLIWYGFSRWYSRTQVPLDKKLNNEIRAPRKKKKI